jgi:site-specific DNA-methyltransferase (cytosine-N4-specific)
LENKYDGVVEHRLEWRRLVTYVPNKKLPLYNWFKYKEGFSRELVVQLIREFGLQAGETVLDPFAGSGTTLLTAKEFGIHGIGIDMLPTAVFVANAKLKEWPDIDALLQSALKLTSTPFREPKSSLPDVRIINLAFDKETQKQLKFFKEEIETYDQSVRDFLMLGLLSILEDVSSTSKDGQFLRLVEKDIRKSVRSVFGQKPTPKRRCFVETPESYACR